MQMNIAASSTLQHHQHCSIMNIAASSTLQHHQHCSIINLLPFWPYSVPTAHTVSG
jgi:hypothetical protein